MCLEDLVEQVGVLGAVAGDEGVVEELVLDRAGQGGIAGRRFHRLAQHHEGRRLFVRQLGDGGNDVAAGDEEQVVDPLGVDVVGGVHEVAALDHRAAVAGAGQVVEVDAAVLADGDVLQERVLAEAGIVGFPLLARVEAIGLDEQAAGLEAAEAAVAVERAAVVLDQPGALVALAGQHLAGGAGLAVGAEGHEQRVAGHVRAVAVFQGVLAAAGMEENGVAVELRPIVLAGEDPLLPLAEVIAVADELDQPAVGGVGQPDGDVLFAAAAWTCSARTPRRRT